MAEDQTKTQPLLWQDEYEKLLAEMDREIHRMESEELRMKWIRYQTLIIAGGHFGLRAKEFLNLSWSQLVNKSESSAFQYKTKRKRKFYFSKNVIRLLNHNYELVNPWNIHHLVLHKQKSPMEPISTRQFNESFARILSKCGITAANPSSHTLRKTFAHHIWADLYEKSEEGILVACEMLDHQDPKETKVYLGITDKKIKDTYLRF
ncbi:MAG: tyrosine-type recombinase/integrase [Balneola sp.]